VHIKKFFVALSGREKGNPNKVQGTKRKQTKQKQAQQATQKRDCNRSLSSLRQSQEKNHVKSDKNTHKFHIFSLALKPFLPSTHDEHERELVHTTPHHTRVD
jgi:hypothetical protein